MKKKQQKAINVVVYDHYPTHVTSEGVLRGPCSYIRDRYINADTVTVSFLRRYHSPYGGKTGLLVATY